MKKNKQSSARELLSREKEKRRKKYTPIINALIKGGWGGEGGENLGVVAYVCENESMSAAEESIESE